MSDRNRKPTKEEVEMAIRDLGETDLVDLACEFGCSQDDIEEALSS